MISCSALEKKKSFFYFYFIIPTVTLLVFQFFIKSSENTGIGSTWISCLENCVRYSPFIIAELFFFLRGEEMGKSYCFLKLLFGHKWGWYVSLVDSFQPHRMIEKSQTFLRLIYILWKFAKCEKRSLST